MLAPVDGSYATTGIDWLSGACARAEVKSVNVWMSCPLMLVMTVKGCIPAACAGDAVFWGNATMPTPSWTGWTDVAMTEEKITAKRIARTMFVAGPAANRRARSRRGRARSSSSSGSTKAPIGKIRKIRPRDRIRILATRARIPCENSWRMIATARPKIP